MQKHDTAGQATDENIMGRMRFTCWINKATDTHREYAIMVARKRFDVTFVRTLRVLSLSSSTTHSVART